MFRSAKQPRRRFRKPIAPSTARPPNAGAELHIRKPEQPEQDASNTGNG
jgi:hypothetical protein